MLYANPDDDLNAQSQADVPSTPAPQQTAAQPVTLQNPGPNQAPVQVAQQPKIVRNPGVPAQAQDANAPDPAVQRAQQKGTFIRTLAESLAGGPRFQTVINPSTGETRHDRIPLSRGEIGMAIALEAISGGLAGLSARGPNATGQAGLLGLQQGQKIKAERQQQQQEQDEQANKDFVRRAAVAEANLRMLNNAVQVGRLQREDHDSMVSAYADQLQDFKDNSPNVIKATGLSEDEAKDVQKWPLADFLRIPDGTVPRLGPDGQQIKSNGVPQWDNTYALVDKNAKASLTNADGQPAQWVKDAVAWNLPGYQQSILTGLGAGSQVSAATAGRAQHQVVMLNALQSELNSFAASFGKDKGGKPVMSPVDLKAALQSDPRLLTAVQSFQRAAGASTQPDRQIDAMRQDPKTAPYAAQIINLFGADNLEKFKSAREAREAAEKTRAEAQARADVDIEKETKLGPIRTANELDKEKKLIPVRAATAGAEAKARAEATATAPKNEDGSWNMSSVPVQLVEGTIDPSQLSKRSQQYNQVIEAANAYSLQRYGKAFDLAQAQSDYRFASNPSTQNTLRYLNSLTGADNRSGNLGALVSLSNKINRTSFPALNDAAAWARLQTGDPQMASYHAAVTEVADQIAKILQGGGSGSGTSDAKLKQAAELFDKGFNKDQITGVSDTLRTLLANRKTELIGDNRYLRKQFGQPNSAAPALQQGFVRFQDSQGGLHDIPQANLPAARQRDPGLRVVQQ